MSHCDHIPSIWDLFMVTFEIYMKNVKKKSQNPRNLERNSANKEKLIARGNPDLNRRSRLKLSDGREEEDLHGRGGL